MLNETRKQGREMEMEKERGNGRREASNLLGLRSVS